MDRAFFVLCDHESMGNDSPIDELDQILAAHDIELFAHCGDRKIFVDKSIVRHALQLSSVKTNDTESTQVGRIDLGEIDRTLEALYSDESFILPRHKAIWILRALKAVILESIKNPFS